MTTNLLSNDYFLSEKDIYINYNRWNPIIDNNILYITGINLNQIDTLGVAIWKSNPSAIRVSLDNIKYFIDKSYKPDDIAFYDKLIYDVVQSYISLHPNYTLYDLNHIVFNYMIKYANTHYYKLFILEGELVYKFLNRLDLMSKPVIITGTALIDTYGNDDFKKWYDDNNLEFSIYNIRLNDISSMKKNIIVKNINPCTTNLINETISNYPDNYKIETIGLFCGEQLIGISQFNLNTNCIIKMETINEDMNAYNYLLSYINERYNCDNIFIKNNDRPLTYFCKSLGYTKYLECASGSYYTTLQLVSELNNKLYREISYDNNQYGAISSDIYKCTESGYIYIGKLDCNPTTGEINLLKPNTKVLESFDELLAITLEKYKCFIPNKNLNDIYLTKKLSSLNPELIKTTEGYIPKLNIPKKITTIMENGFINLPVMYLTEANKDDNKNTEDDKEEKSKENKAQNTNNNNKEDKNSSDDEVKDYTEDSDVKEDEVQSDEEDENMDYTEDSDNTDDESSDENEEVSSEPEDTSDNTSTELDDDTLDYTDDTTSTDVDEVQSDEEDENMDYTEDSDNTDDESSDENEEAQEIDETSSNNRNNNVIKNYNLIKKFSKMYNITCNLIDELSSKLFPEAIQNIINAQVLNNLREIKKFIEDFMRIHFDRFDYIFNIYHYNMIIMALQLNVKLLSKTKELYK